jgi:hypothetical protein
MEDDCYLSLHALSGQPKHKSIQLGAFGEESGLGHFTGLWQLPYISQQSFDTETAVVNIPYCTYGC